MFTLARADSGAYAIERRSFYLNDAVAEALAAAQLLALPKRIQLRSSPLAEMPYFGDEDLIRQLIVILLDNAIKYTPEGGCVEISVEPDHTIVVSDTGVGIPEEAHERIFDRFYRIDKARSRSSAKRSGGAGLGLAIARWIAQIHGGTVSVRNSKPGHGSVFAAKL
jgi:signal transduction histidine kinase